MTVSDGKGWLLKLSELLLWRHGCMLRLARHEAIDPSLAVALGARS